MKDPLPCRHSKSTHRSIAFTEKMNSRRTENLPDMKSFVESSLKSVAHRLALSLGLDRNHKLKPFLSDLHTFFVHIFLVSQTTQHHSLVRNPPANNFDSWQQILVTHFLRSRYFSSIFEDFVDCYSRCEKLEEGAIWWQRDQGGNGDAIRNQVGVLAVTGRDVKLGCLDFGLMRRSRLSYRQRNKGGFVVSCVLIGGGRRGFELCKVTISVDLQLRRSRKKKLSWWWLALTTRYME